MQLLKNNHIYSTHQLSSFFSVVGLQCVLCTTVSDTGECLDPDGYATCSTSNICIAVNAVFFSEGDALSSPSPYRNAPRLKSLM